MKGLIKDAGSSSFVMPTYGKLVKGVLSVLGFLGIEFLYKEQYMIADINYMIDISDTEKGLGWKPRYNDEDLMRSAYEYYIETVHKR